MREPYHVGGEHGVAVEPDAVIVPNILMYHHIGAGLVPGDGKFAGEGSLSTHEPTLTVDPMGDHSIANMFPHT